MSRAETKLVPHQRVQTQEVHCTTCGRFLGNQAILLGVAQWKCKCGELITIDVMPDKGVRY